MVSNKKEWGMWWDTCPALYTSTKETHKKILNLGTLRHWRRAFPHDQERRT